MALPIFNVQAVWVVARCVVLPDLVCKQVGWWPGAWCCPISCASNLRAVWVVVRCMALPDLVCKHSGW